MGTFAFWTFNFGIIKWNWFDKKVTQWGENREKWCPKLWFLRPNLWVSTVLQGGSHSGFVGKSGVVKGHKSRLYYVAWQLLCKDLRLKWLKHSTVGDMSSGPCEIHRDKGAQLSWQKTTPSLACPIWQQGLLDVPPTVFCKRDPEAVLCRRQIMQKQPLK